MLPGTGVLVTRPAKEAARLAQRLEAVGGRAVIFPGIVIEPAADRAAIGRAQQALREADYAFFVSANAVEHGLAGLAAPPPPRVVAAAPGPGTAEALRRAGFARVLVPATSFDSEGLLALPELADLRGRRVLIFRGEGGRELLGEGLRARGAHVEQVACYRRVAPASGAEGLVEALRAGRVQAVSLTSSEALANIWALLPEEGRERLRALPAFVPHPRIARAATGLGIVEVVTTAAGDAGLVAALLARFEPRVEPAR